MDDPFDGAQREPEIDDLWWGPIPGAIATDGRVVCCSYFVMKAQYLVRCNSYALLSPPF